MKCVKNPITNEVRRASEERALHLVSAGWVFVPKSAWKAAPDTDWVQNTTPANPMSESKKRRLEMRQRSH